MKIRIIGDVHGKYDEYLKLTEGADYSVQVGDMGFSYDHMEDLNSLNHSFFGGNHDNYNKIVDVTHCHENFGMRHKGDGARGEVFQYFIARGAYSIDKEYRTPGVSWWQDEEMDHVTANHCLEQWYRRRPEIVLTHDCPSSMVPFFITNNFKIVP
jgi:hypothetical protein